MKYIIFSIYFLTSFCVFGQKNSDNRIIISFSDTSNLYEKVRLALINEDFMVKGDKKNDTLSTFPLNIQGNSFMIIYASIKKNVIELWGYLGYSNNNLMGITINPSKKDYKKIFYYKRDKYWKKMHSIAMRLNGDIYYNSK